MKKIWETLKGYFWWTRPRGSFHYDVMVTLILLFIFVSPRFIDFQDKPAEHLPRPNSVLVMPDGDRGLIFHVDARDIKADTQVPTLDLLRHVIEPIAPGVIIDHWAPEQDARGHLVGYHVWAHR
jgi:hypothetical protein